MPSWRLTSPKTFSPFALRAEYAYGGASRVNREDAAAKRVGKKHRLTAEQVAANPDAASPAAKQAIAHAAFEGNAVGRGYAQPWYLNATRTARLAAPRVELARRPFTAAQFHKLPDCNGTTMPADALNVAGLGVRSKVHPQRRCLAGTIDQEFIDGAAWLPKDFDFGVWNAAPLDQQTAFLRGDEIVELTNLCAPDCPGASVDADGQTSLRLHLPAHACTLLMRMQDGTMFFHPMNIDTVIIEPEDRTLSLVWRAVFAKTPAIRAVDAHLHGEYEAGFTEQLRHGIAPQSMVTPSDMAQAATLRERHG